MIVQGMVRQHISNAATSMIHLELCTVTVPLWGGIRGCFLMSKQLRQN